VSQRHAVAGILGLLFLALEAGCDRGEPGRAQPPAVTTPAPARETAAPAGPAAPAAPAVPSFTRHPGGPRIVAIGDLHGDLDAARAALRLAGAIDARDRWSGGTLVVVQTGDQLDRGDDERAILELFARLAKEARAAGGAFLALNGNHETMNVQGDFRYVTSAGFRGWTGVAPASPLSSRAGPVERARASAFLPGGAYAQVLAERDVVAVVGDSVFAHGGVLPEHVAYGLDRLNHEVRAWMTGQRAIEPELIAGERAPGWTRVYGAGEPSALVCAELERVLAALGAKRLVVGHTIQPSGINAACDGKVYRIDVGMARYYGDNPIQALEIGDGGVKILSSPRAELLGRN
jgi:hypothetical protein